MSDTAPLVSSDYPHPVSAVPYIDTHAHHHSTVEKLNVASFETLRNEHFPSNFQSCVNVLCDVEDIFSETLFQSLTTTAKKDGTESTNEWIALALGLHPHQAAQYTDAVEDRIVKCMAHPKVVAWGEIGLDYHYMNSHRDVQIAVFVRQIKCAVGSKKPIVIHTREAEDDTWNIMTEHIPVEWPVHVHCFTDSPSLGMRLLDHFPNLCIGITGVVTYNSAKNTRQIAVTAPLNRLLLETDSPYMVPAAVNKRKKSKDRVGTCHSGYLPFVAETIAALRGCEVDLVMRTCTENARRLYGI